MQVILYLFLVLKIHNYAMVKGHTSNCPVLICLSTRTPVLSNRTGRSGQRNSGHATQRSSGRNLQSPGKGRFLFQHVPGPQKICPAETGIQSKKAKYFCTHPTLQN